MRSIPNKAQTPVVITVFLALLTFLPESLPADSFIDCDKALTTREFSTLKKFYRQGYPDREIGPHKAGLCVRLSPSRFLITAVGTKDLWRDGLYFIDTGKKTIRQETETRIKIGREFASDGPERFILLSQHVWAGGSLHEGHLLLRLTPVQAKERGYKIYRLLFNVRDSVDPESPCSSCLKEGDRQVRAPRNEKAEFVETKVINEGTGDAAIVYTVTEQDCRTCQKGLYTKTFRLVQEQQKEVPPAVAATPPTAVMFERPSSARKQ